MHGMVEFYRCRVGGGLSISHAINPKGLKIQSINNFLKLPGFTVQ